MITDDLALLREYAQSRCDKAFAQIVSRNVDLVSKRVGNFQHHPLFGVLLDQLWVK